MSSRVEPSMPNKEENFSEWYNLILEKADLVDIRYGVKGTIVYKPNLMEIVDRLYELFEEELKRRGRRKVLFPIFITEDNLKRESEHIKGFEAEVFWVTSAGKRTLEKKLALRPTSETAFYPMYSLWIKSWKDLPLKLFQSVMVYRYETKATKPLIRGREFPWIETHDAFKSEEEARQQVREDTEIFEKVVYRELGIPFLHLKREEFDKFPGAVDTYAFETLLPDGRVLQIGTTHYLGTNFSKVFGIMFQDYDGEMKYVYQTCFGIGISRIIAALISIHGDEFGLVLPFKVAPIQVVIVPIPKKGVDLERLLNYCSEVEKCLRDEGYRVLLDSTEKTPGEKFYKYDSLGVPARLEIGVVELEKEKVTVFRRDKRERKSIDRGELVKYLKWLELDMLNYLRSRAEKRLRERIVKVRSREEFVKVVSQGNHIVVAGFCGREECAGELKSQTGVEVRGSVDSDSNKLNCVWCGSPNSKKAYFAKAY